MMMAMGRPITMMDKAMHVNSSRLTHLDHWKRWDESLVDDDESSLLTEERSLGLLVDAWLAEVDRRP